MGISSSSSGNQRVCGAFSRVTNKPLCERIDDIKTLCVKRIPQWKNIPFDHIFVYPIKSALSNTIMYVKVVERAVPSEHKETTSGTPLTDGEGPPTASPSSPLSSSESSVISLPTPSRVIIRFYGRASSFFFDSNHERIIARYLPTLGLGAPVIAEFPNDDSEGLGSGRIEGYLPGRNLLHTDLAIPHIATESAHFLARLHSVKLDSAAGARLPRDPVLIRNLDDWFTRTRGISFPNDASTIPAVLKDTVTPKQWAANQDRKQAMLDALGIGAGGSLAREIEWLKHKLLPFNSPVVFCHNDAQEGNLLYYDPNEPQSEPGCTPTSPSPSVTIATPTTDATKDYVASNLITEAFVGVESKRTGAPSIPPPASGWELRAIDFEYAAFNYRGFDLGNHMCEHVFNNNYEHYPYYSVDDDNFPSPSFFRAFCREYLRARRQVTNDTSEISDREVDALVLETEYFMLSSNLQWCVWGIIQAYHQPSSTFGYMEYARDRWREYVRQKKLLLQRDGEHTSPVDMINNKYTSLAMHDDTTPRSGSSSGGVPPTEQSLSSSPSSPIAGVPHTRDTRIVA